MKRKRTFIKILIMLIVLVMSMAGILTSCKEPVEEEKGEFSTTNKVDLNLAVMYNQDAYITYNKGNLAPDNEGGYLAADGVRVRDGDIKPVWKELMKRLNFGINDLSFEGKYSTLTDQYTMLQATAFKGVDMLNGDAADIVDEGITYGTFVDIAQYLDRMPNLKKFLDENSIVKSSIVSGEGKMYYAPYFDGYDDIERMFMMRVDWVQKLLDGATKPTFDTAATVSTVYTPFMPAAMSDKKFTIVNAAGIATQEITKSYTQNIITAQNALTVKNGDTLTTALRDYIDSTYGSTFGTNRSQLFTGVNAAYDPDELVALLRCVKANPEFLNGNPDAVIVPFYPRGHTGDRVMDLVRLSEIWGVRGLDARNTWCYIDENGVLQDTRYQQKTMDGIEKLNMLYQEGLILENFNENSATLGLGEYSADKTHRGRLNKQNLGFMTYDFNQTTTVLNNLDAEITGFNLTPVLPPFTDWGYKTGEAVDYVRFTDSWRSVKDDGWGILSNISTEKKERALKLMDYMYSPEGNRLMSYGPEAWIDGTIKYNGKDVPKLSEEALTELAVYAKGNYTNYFRQFLGSTFPIGYVKEQGMEYQCVHEKGKVGLNNILKAIELGTMSHLVIDTTDVEDKLLYTVPTTLAYTKQQQALINDNTGTLDDNFDIESSNGKESGVSNNVLYTLIKTGFTGTKNTKADNITKFYQTWQGKIFLACSQDAYANMIAG